MQLEENIAKELAGIVKEQIRAIEKRLDVLTEATVKSYDDLNHKVELTPEKGDPGEKGERGDPGEKGENGKDGADGKDLVDIDAPDDVVDSISKAIALLAEAPPLTQARDNGPVVVQFTPPLGKRVKTITTRRDDKGNLVARVVED